MEKRTTIFSIFVLLCLLPNSIYARTIEYETPKDTTLDMTLYFDLNARQVNKDYHRNGKTLTVLDSLLANPAHSIHLNSIILVSPDLYNGKKEQGIPLGQKRSEEVKVFLCGKYPQVNTAQICIRKGEEYGDALRKLITDDRLVPDREDVLALIDYHHDNPVKMQDFLQRLDAGIPYQYISDRVLPELRRTEIRVCLSYPEENGGKNSSAEQAARIEETEFIPIDRETTVTPMTMQVLPQKERTQVIIETEKTVIKVEKKKETKEKRHGIAGGVFMWKIGGAKAALGGTLDEVIDVAQKTVDNTRSICVGLSPCAIPAVGHPNFQIEDGKMEFGIGHHGEPGINVQDLKPAKDIARQMAKAVIDDMEPEEGSEVAVLMSGLGATPVMELYVLYDEVEEYLKEQGLSVYKVFIGDYVTSLDMNGAALTVLKLDDELKELLDYEAKSPGIEV